MKFLYRIMIALIVLFILIILGIGYVWYRIAFSPEAIVSPQADTVVHTTPVSESNALATTSTPATPIIATTTATTTKTSSTSSLVHPSVPPKSTPKSTPSAASQSSGVSIITTPIKLDVTKMTDAQKTFLKTMGIDPVNLVVTPQMQVCATDAIGASRLMDIVNGAMPSIPEGLNLVVCINKK